MRRTGMKRRTEPMKRTGFPRPSLTVVRDIESASRRKPTAATGPSAKVRAMVYERDGWACVCCGLPITNRPHSVQHRKRRSQGGDNSLANLITLAGTGTTGCHLRVDSRIDPEDEAKGYTVRSFDDPADVSVMVFGEHGSGVVKYLTADGGYSDYPPPDSAA